MKKNLRKTGCRLLTATLALGVIFNLSSCSSEKKIKVGKTTLELSEQGEIVSLKIDGRSVGDEFHGYTAIEGATATLRSSHKISSGWEFEKEFTSASGSCIVTERFYKTENSIRWEMEIVGGSDPWSVPIQTRIQYPVQEEKTLVWAPWGGPNIQLQDVKDEALRGAMKLMPDTTNWWINPLQAVPFTDGLYYYGSPYVTYENPQIAYCPEYPDVISIPFVSVLNLPDENGLSIILSPEDRIQDLTMETGVDGTITFSRIYHRIVKSNPLHFALDIVSHDADWREGMEWMTKRYPKYFNPINEKLAFELNGTSSYAGGDPNDFDADKMKAMAYSTNWKASFDFPYMGMFIPPIEDIDTKWKRYGGDSTNIREMAAYATRMKERGFHTLNYFNINEFGTGVIFPDPEISEVNHDFVNPIWADCNRYLYNRGLSDAILLAPEGMNLEGCYYPLTKNGGPFYTWGDGIVMDCSVESYKKFLLAQAERHLKYIPDADGFCIDRMDWFHYFNEQKDDGETWFEGKAVWAMNRSWREFMAEFSPMVHGAGKVIFANTHTKRLDLLKEVDGIHDEYTSSEAALNMTAFLAFRKPALGWVWKRKSIEDQGVDNYFQRFLYMGVFPMAPFPGNDHSIRPDEWTDRAYLDYGPLMQQMKYRKWVLSPLPVVVEDQNAKANIFEVPDGFIIPVVYASGDLVKLNVPAIKGGEKWRVTALHPGENTPVELEFSNYRNGISIAVPVKRNCAMVKVERVKE